MKWFLAICQLVGGAAIGTALGRLIGRPLGRLIARGRPIHRMSRAIDRFGCRMVGGHRQVWRAVPMPGFVSIRSVCRDCGVDAPVTLEPGQSISIEVSLMSIDGGAELEVSGTVGVRPDAVEPLVVPDIPVAVAGELFFRAPPPAAIASIFGVDPAVAGFDESVRLDRRPNLRAYEDRWSDEDSHADTAQVVTFDSDTTSMCWRCGRRPEETTIGLCVPCRDDVREGREVRPEGYDGERMIDSYRRIVAMSTGENTSAPAHTPDFAENREPGQLIRENALVTLIPLLQGSCGDPSCPFCGTEVGDGR